MAASSGPSSEGEILETAETNAVRLLEPLGIPLELREYEVDSEDVAEATTILEAGLAR